ncbi:hypothetical protein ACQKP8_00980 [Photobacterium alginatilyticum]|uniref:hypothetical protein n=1 Tax=Photobacterium alginatilyticum TaxID=1775171 RepID=UPI004067BBA8
MSFNLTSKLGKSIQPPAVMPTAKSNMLMEKVGKSRLSNSNIKIDNRPILQLNALPMTLSPKTYENAHSSINPNGSFTSLYAFSQLANTIPTFSEYYSDSLNRISSVYGNLLRGSSVGNDEQYTESVISDSLRTYESSDFSNMDGIPDSWYPVYATPVDWYDTSDPERFSEITLDLIGEDADDGPYRVLQGGTNILSSLTQSGSGLSVPIDKDTSLKSIKFKYLEVRLNRPWLNFEVFKLDGWFIKGQNAGYFSSGNFDINSGVIPLITTSMLVAIDVELAAEWSVKDKQALDDARQKGERVSVGPFVTHLEPDSEPELHVIGWVSQLVPLSPQIED